MENEKKSIESIEKSKCFGCGACAYSCNNNAISIVLDAEGFYYPKLDADKCTKCGACLNICPVINKQNNTENPAIYTVKANSNEVLMKSSSGGAFSLISDFIIKENGLICGAVFDEDFGVRHVLSDNIEKMRKSKYVQSDISNVFSEIESALKQGRKVLFSGTPCQCHAVKNLMGNFHNQIIFVSLICRGVASVRFWKNYIEYLEKNHGKIETFDFRDKIAGENGRAVTYKTENGEVFSKYINDDAYMCIYSKTLSYRPSCYTCPYTKIDNDFDFTIGDAWNSQGFSMDNDGRGLSLVIARSKEAKEIMNKLCDDAAVSTVCNTDYMQTALKKPPEMSILRKLFFKDLTSNMPMEVIFKKYGTGIKK